jgi:DNA-binding NtrC family response regulator
MAATTLSPMTPSVLLAGLEAALAEELRQTLSLFRLRVQVEDPSNADDMAKLVESSSADLVFCPAEKDQRKSLLSAARKQGPKKQVVVVSRIPQVTDWLDAIEDGAVDYCAAPFEPNQMQWILQSALRPARIAPAA